MDCRRSLVAGAPRDDRGVRLWMTGKARGIWMKRKARGIGIKEKARGIGITVRAASSRQPKAGGDGPLYRLVPLPTLQFMAAPPI